MNGALATHGYQGGLATRGYQVLISTTYIPAPDVDTVAGVLVALSAMEGSLTPTDDLKATISVINELEGVLTHG